MALRSASGALGRIKEAWHHAPALAAALKSAEAACSHKALPREWINSSECMGKLTAARTQLQQLQDWEKQEREMLAKTPAVNAAALAATTPPVAPAALRAAFFFSFATWRRCASCPSTSSSSPLPRGSGP